MVAADVIARPRERCPEPLVGAGTTVRTEDVARALAAGARFGLSPFEFFLAVPAGGLALLRSIAAPLAALGLRVVPAGGITGATLPARLGEPAVAAAASARAARARS